MIDKIVSSITPLEQTEKINEIIENVNVNAVKRNIGEIVASTLPLVDAGLHLLDGALIQGDGIYADFVNYIAELYNDNPNASYFAQAQEEQETTWIRPNLSADGTLGGDSFAVSASSIYSSAHPAYTAVDGNTNTWWASSVSTSVDFIFYNPDPIKVTQLSWSSYASEYTTQGAIYGSNNNSTWTKITNYTNNSADITINMSSNTAYYKYYKISSTAVNRDFSIRELTITATKISSPALTPEQVWQQSISTYGVCGKFVYNPTNNTVRLPKITGIIEGTTDVNALGDLVEAGLPNITGSDGVALFSGVIMWGQTIQGDGAIKLTAADAKVAPTGSDSNFSRADLSFDASRSNSIYGNSTTVQPQTIKAFYYIVMATSTKTDIQVDIDEITTDLNGKADTDLTNVTNTGYIKMAGAGMPSDRYIDLTLGASGATYTAPANGWFTLRKIANSDGSANDKYCDVYNNTSSIGVHNNGRYSFQFICTIPALKGDIILINYNATGNTNLFRFIYAQGSESEVQ